MPAVRAHRPPHLTFRGFLLCTSPFPLAGGSATAGEGGVPPGVSDRLEQRLAVVAAEAPERGSGRAVLAQQIQDGRHDRDAVVVGVEAALAVPALPVVVGVRSAIFASCFLAECLPT
ncbi:hypothetical protein ACWGI0_09825 [Streptomyces sp. NPDC054802]